MQISKRYCNTQARVVIDWVPRTGTGALTKVYSNNQQKHNNIVFGLAPERVSSLKKPSAETPPQLFLQLQRYLWYTNDTSWLLISTKHCIPPLLSLGLAPWNYFKKAYIYFKKAYMQGRLLCVCLAENRSHARFLAKIVLRLEKPILMTPPTTALLQC